MIDMMVYWDLCDHPFNSLFSLEAAAQTSEDFIVSSFHLYDIRTS